MVTVWTNVPKPVLAVSSITTVVGNPIGLLLALTYATTSSVETAGTLWTDVAKASGTSWTKVTKAT